jgi:hypothetical protein
MTMKTATALLLIVALALTALLTFQARTLSRLRAALAVVANNLEDTRHRLAEEQQRGRVQAAERARLEQQTLAASEAAALVAAPDASPVPDSASAREARNFMATFRAKNMRPHITAAEFPSLDFRSRVGRDPALRELYHQAFVDSLDPIWAAFFKSANLAPEQVAKFKASQWELEQVKLDAAWASVDQGANGEIMREAWRVGDRAMKAEIKALLGGSEDAYANYHAYAQAANVRPALGELAGLLASSENPLTHASAEALAKLFAAHSRKTPGGWAVANEINWDTMLPQAQVFLTPLQFAALQAIHDKTRAYDKIEGFLADRERR